MGGAGTCWGVNSLLLLSLLDDESDELLDQKDEDKEPDEAPHSSQDDESHGVVHFFHCEAGQEEKSGVVGRQGSWTHPKLSALASGRDTASSPHTLLNSYLVTRGRCHPSVEARLQRDHFFRGSTPSSTQELFPVQCFGATCSGARSQTDLL